MKKRTKLEFPSIQQNHNQLSWQTAQRLFQGIKIFPAYALSNLSNGVRDNHATNGIVHLVDKVIVPAEGTITDVLSADMHFQTMMNALEANDLGEMLSNPGHFTIFVPTDEAFEKLDEITRGKIIGNGGCSADLIKSHILSEVKQ